MDPRGENKRQKTLQDDGTLQKGESALELVLGFMEVRDLFPNVCVTSKYILGACRRLLKNFCETNHPAINLILKARGHYSFHRFDRLLNSSNGVARGFVIFPSIPLEFDASVLLDYEVFLEITTVEPSPRVLCHDVRPLDISDAWYSEHGTIGCAFQVKNCTTRKHIPIVSLPPPNYFLPVRVRVIMHRLSTGEATVVINTALGDVDGYTNTDYFTEDASFFVKTFCDRQENGDVWFTSREWFGNGVGNSDDAAKIYFTFNGGFDSSTKAENAFDLMAKMNTWQWF